MQLFLYLHKCALEILFKLCKSMKTAGRKKTLLIALHHTIQRVEWFVYELSLIRIVKLSDTLVMFNTE